MRAKVPTAPVRFRRLRSGFDDPEAQRPRGRALARSVGGDDPRHVASRPQRAAPDPAAERDPVRAAAGLAGERADSAVRAADRDLDARDFRQLEPEGGAAVAGPGGYGGASAADGEA